MGSIELDRLDAARMSHGVVQPVGHARLGKSRITAPGLDLTLDAKVDWHAADAMVVLLQGNPVLEGKAVRAADVISVCKSGSGRSLPLGGRFSAIVIDGRGRSLLLQTDRFGVWPLCWSQAGERVAFADRADAVPSCVASEIDPAGAVRVCLLPHDSSASDGVPRCIAPGTCYSPENQPQWRRHSAILAAALLRASPR